MLFEVHLSGHAKGFLKKSEDSLYNRLITKLDELSKDPFPADAKRVLGRKEKLFRVRVGDYRILYTVFLEKKAVLIINIDKRSKVYKK